MAVSNEASNRTLKRLTDSEFESYQENGFIKLSNLLSVEEFSQICAEYDDLFARKQEEQGKMEAKWKGDWSKDNSKEKTGKSVLSIHNLQQHSGVFTKFITNSAVLDCLEDIIGDGIILHHTKAHLKPPREGAAFPSHQDFHYFPYRDDSMVAVFLHLEDTNKQNGGLAVFPGSHKLGGQENVSTVPGVYFLDQNKWNIENGTKIEAKAGDIVIFHYQLVHASYPNKSDIPRRMFLLQVAGSNDVPLTSQHRSPGAGLVLRGRAMATRADLDMRHIDNSTQ